LVKAGTFAMGRKRGGRKRGREEKGTGTFSVQGGKGDRHLFGSKTSTTCHRKTCLSPFPHISLLQASLEKAAEASEKSKNDNKCIDKSP